MSLVSSDLKALNRAHSHGGFRHVLALDTLWSLAEDPAAAGLSQPGLVALGHSPLSSLLPELPAEQRFLGITS